MGSVGCPSFLRACFFLITLIYITLIQGTFIVSSAFLIAHLLSPLVLVKFSLQLVTRDAFEADQLTLVLPAVLAKGAKSATLIV